MRNYFRFSFFGPGFCLEKVVAVGLLKKPILSSKRHRGLIARATNALKSETVVGRAILPADFFNSPAVPAYSAPLTHAPNVIYPG